MSGTQALKKIRIAVDFDNILSQLTKAAVDCYNILSDDYLTVDDITDYNITNFFKAGYSVEEMFRIPLFWTIPQPIQGAVEGLQELLSNPEFEVKILTASHLEDMPIKYNWLKRYYPYITRDDICVVNDKSWIAADILIDDCPKNLMTGGYAKILYDCAWNKNFDEEAYGVQRVHSWDGILNAVYDIAMQIRKDAKKRSTNGCAEAKTG